LTIECSLGQYQVVLMFFGTKVSKYHLGGHPFFACLHWRGKFAVFFEIAILLSIGWCSADMERFFSAFHPIFYFRFCVVFGIFFVIYLISCQLSLYFLLKQSITKYQKVSPKYHLFCSYFQVIMKVSLRRKMWYFLILCDTCLSMLIIRCILLIINILYNINYYIYYIYSRYIFHVWFLLKIEMLWVRELQS